MSERSDMEGRFQSAFRAVMNARAHLEYLPGPEHDDNGGAMEAAYVHLDEAALAVVAWARMYGFHEIEIRPLPPVEKPEVDLNGRPVCSRCRVALAESEGLCEPCRNMDRRNL